MPELQTLHVMPHTYRCGAFDCGVPSVNDALRGELLSAIREGRSRAYAARVDAYAVDLNDCCLICKFEIP